MKKIIGIFVLSLLMSCNSNAQTKNTTGKKYKITKTENQWKSELTQMQYFVLRESGTEVAFSSKFNDNHLDGMYVCAACNTALYSSTYKYDSRSGWPSFDRPVKGAVELAIDYEIGEARTELKCATCGGHLGHSFDDGPRETTGKRHCINGAALKFIPKK